MKKLLLASTVLVGTSATVLAADLPRRAAPPPAFTPIPVFTWTGFYLGVNAGYGFDASSRGTSDYVLRSGSVVGSEDTAGVLRVNNRAGNDGFTGGAQIGYNYQFTPGSGFVVGIEADAQYVDFARRANLTQNYTGVGFAGTAFSSQRAYVATSGNGLDYFGTARGRLGYAFDRTLVYATGGYAYASGQDDQNFAGNRFRDSFRSGYAVGGGIEYALPTDSFLNFFKTSAVTLKIEGLYVNLDQQKNAASGVFYPSLLPPSGVAYLNGAAAKTEFAVVRAGVNYKFGSY